MLNSFKQLQTISIEKQINKTILFNLKKIKLLHTISSNYKQCNWHKINSKKQLYLILNNFQTILYNFVKKIACNNFTSTVSGSDFVISKIQIQLNLFLFKDLKVGNILLNFS